MNSQNHDDYMQIILDACETETPEATVSNKRTSSGTSDVASDSPLTDSHNKKSKKKYLCVLFTQDYVIHCITTWLYKVGFSLLVFLRVQMILQHVTGTPTSLHLDICELLLTYYKYRQAAAKQMEIGLK